MEQTKQYIRHFLHGELEAFVIRELVFLDPNVALLKLGDFCKNNCKFYKDARYSDGKFYIGFNLPDQHVLIIDMVIS